jgi:CubicO group peptidase (beta-lactamase class C family)
MSLPKTIDLMTKAAADGVFPGAVLLVGLGEDRLLDQAFGYASLHPEKRPLLKNTLFDLASLTKPLATTLGIMALIEKGRLALDQSLESGKYKTLTPVGSGMTIRHLLAHSSGLPAYQPYFLRLEKEKGHKKALLRDWVRKEPLLYPLGSQTVYSDLGFILLEWILEEATGEGLDSWTSRNIYLPLGLTALGFRPIGASGVAHQDMVASTEDCPWRKKILQGEVHDENTYVIGGVSGQAGLFGTASDLFQLIRVLKKAYDHPQSSSLFDGRLVRLFWTGQMAPPKTTRALGFDTPSETDSSAGRFFSRKSVGHLGFTGTSFWLDLEQDLAVVLLTNRVHPTRTNETIRFFRPRLHDLVYQEVMVRAGRNPEERINRKF